MKRISLLMICAFALTTGVTFAQQPAAGPSAQAVPPDAVKHQIGLIDMAHIFKNYEKFTAMTASLQKEIEQTDLKAKGMVESMQQLQAQLTSGNLQEGSPDYARIEQQLLKAQTDLESFRRVAQRDVIRKEADVYKTIYLEIEELVQQYSRHFGYTLVLRFDRNAVTDAENPRDIIAGMNRQVVFHRNEHDITEPILNYLNERWRKQQTATGPTGPATK